MSSYHGRRAPNVSQYIANLNHVPSSHELASEISLGDGDLDFLTNAEFFDFDSFHPGAAAAAHSHNADHHYSHNHSPRDGAQYQFGEFQTYPTPVTPSSATALHGHYPPQPPHQLAYGPPNVGDKRKQSVVASIASPADMEEQSRMAAEEDKRRRNTAASARFRVKKKQREQALEKQAKDMSDKVSALESKVQQLEMENKWLKGLITDKNDGKTIESLRMEKDEDERKPGEHTTGVGTGISSNGPAVEYGEDDDEDLEDDDEE